MAIRTARGLMPIRRSAVAFLGALVLASTACTSSTPPVSPSGGAAPAKTLTVAATVEPTTLDMTAAPAVAAGQVQLYNVYETLVKLDSDGELRSLLADRWSVSTDRLTYTFFLNPAAKFASGKPVTAAAVAANIERVRTSQTVAAKYSASMSVVASTAVVDDTTLTVTLKRPSNVWLYSMADTAGMIADPDAFATLGTVSAGSGPYTISAWNRGDSIVLGRNDHYWGTRGRYDTVTFRYFADPSAMNAAMLASTIDVITNEQTPDALVQFSDPSQYTVIEGDTNMEVTLGLNNSTKALKDLRVRKAIAMAINKQKLLNDVEAGHGVVLGSMSVPTDPYYQDLSTINGYDPDQAKKLLKVAGYSSGLTLRFKPAALPYATAAAEVIASDLKAVGINTKITEQQFPASWVDTVYTKADYDLTIVGHAEARDLVTYTNPKYYWRYSNKEFNTLYAAADQAPAAEYAPGMAKAAQFLTDDAASVWLYMMPNLVVTKSTVTGVASNAVTDSFDITTIATR